MQQSRKLRIRYIDFLKKPILPIFSRLWIQMTDEKFKTVSIVSDFNIGTIFGTTSFIFTQFKVSLKTV